MIENLRHNTKFMSGHLSLDSSLKEELDHYIIEGLRPKFKQWIHQLEDIEIKTKKTLVKKKKELRRQAFSRYNQAVLALVKRLISFLKVPIPFPDVTRFLSLFTDLARIGFFSALLFSIGFFSLNAKSYSQIMMAWLSDYNEAQVKAPVEEVAADLEIEKVPVPAGVNIEPETPSQESLLVIDSPELKSSVQSAQNTDFDAFHFEVLPPDARLIIPKLKKNVPVIFSNPQKLMGADWKSLEETFQEDLKNGVIHYPGTAEPGEQGNAFITGHSSYYFWDDGRYKDVFVLLHTLEVGDEIIMQYDQEQFTYKVVEMKKVKNSDISVLNQETDQNLLTLMTCTPVGTNISRLVVVAEQQ